MSLPSPIPLPIPNLPASSIHIIYDFITPREEEYLIQRIDDLGGDTTSPDQAQSPQTEDAPIQGQVEPEPRPARPGKASTRWGWTELNGRRSMYWGGSLTKKSTLLPLPMPDIMTSKYPHVLRRMQEATTKLGWVEGLNHCLVNEYLPGQGILAHTDGPAYAPIVTTLSLGSHTILQFTPRSDRATPSDEKSDSTAPLNSFEPGSNSNEQSEPFSLFLPPRSLILVQDNLYEDWLHSIESKKEDTMDDLMRCSNWGMWWERGADTFSTGSEEEEEEERRREMKQGDVLSERGIEELIRRRKFVESGNGWDRGRRVSLTCRIVERVVKGFKIG
ncbi:BZ3500_MvSof-1268-A1-R1_Chr12-3g04055 [Microbotryum saponariae]|uniref:BZ3500_MvSof-1268-A1-R1_Chr12-3g04055 protein n=1 Tax=Microbotryum saponariae TaxID=289078 RepID=A0A2X0N5Z5_9BASI|nr:BZ3500_MvSof-1268-A1-R1_Chr12-3g04055 [Microbotryum saponariae]SDA02612.1 BZ3501_MvSof-1269-A2-R1_Chr12-3g03710 [Microbotryum saponariae]